MLENPILKLKWQHRKVKATEKISINAASVFGSEHSACSVCVSHVSLFPSSTKILTSRAVIDGQEFIFMLY